MNNSTKSPLIIEGAHIFFKNFQGKETDYNTAGNRNFCVEIQDEATRNALIADGWNVKETKPRDEDDNPIFYIAVNVSYKLRPPKVVIIQGNAQTSLTEDTIGSLDWTRTSNVDVKITPSQWAFGGKSGTKGYLASLYATIEEDDLEKKYAYLNATNSDDEGLPFK